MINEAKFDVVRELSLLYELSLSIGNSLDLNKNCADFLNVWMRQKNIDFGSVWLKDSNSSNTDTSIYKLVFANPEFSIAKNVISLNHYIQKKLNENLGISITMQMPDFQEICTEKNVTDGCYWLINLPNLGFIKLYFSSKNLSQTAFDLSEVKKASKVILKFSIALQSCLLHETVIKNEVELRQAKEKAEEASRIKQEFMAVVSHEIRTPLNAIMGMTNLIEKTSLSPLQSDYINTVQISADNLQSIINSILDFSKIEAGKMTLQHIPFNLKKMLNNIINSNEFKAEQKGLGLFLKIDEKLNISLLGDSIRLSQVLLNLVSNAIKFTDHGKIEVEARLITKLNNALVVEFSVTDTGKGIATEKQKIIFESFTQEDSSISRKYGGTGLGLSISKQLVELMGGDLRVKSELHLGSTFSFVVGFPISQEPVDDSKSTTQLSSNLLIGKKILVVEDNAMNQFFAQKLLEGWGMKVEIAQNGKEGVEKFRSRYFDCILMDIQMPEMDGFQASEIIRAENTQIPIIALSALVVDEEIEHFNKVGMNDFIAKPFIAEELLQKLIKYITIPQNYSISTQRKAEEKIGKHYTNALLMQMMKGNIVQVRQMEVLFIQQSEEALRNFKELFLKKDWKQIGLLAHKIKASIDMLQINDLKQPIRQLESLGKLENESPEFNVLIQKITDTLAQVCSEIRKTHL